MSVNSFLRWLKPRETVFFDLLESAAQNAFEAAVLFERELRMDDPDRWAELRRQMKEHERRGDEVTHELVDMLNQFFVTPIDREDILALAHALDDVVDRLDAVCERLILYRIGRINRIVFCLVGLNQRDHGLEVRTGFAVKFWFVIKIGRNQL